MTNLELQKGTVNPFLILCKTPDISEILNPHLNFASVVKDTTRAVHMIYNGVNTQVRRSIAKDSLVPALEVRVSLDESRKSVPLGFGCDDTRAIRPDGCGDWVCWGEAVLWPGIGVVRSSEESRGPECGSVCLNHNWDEAMQLVKDKKAHGSRVQR